MLGASCTHSAEEFDESYWTVTLYVPFVVLFFMEMSQSFPLCCVIVTVTESPALTVSGTFREDCGSISSHAEYSTVPLPSTIACVPAWRRSLLVSPPIPTQVASAPLEVADTVGTVQVAVTDVKFPPLAA
jgi:hypothetical protein